MKSLDLKTKQGSEAPHAIQSSVLAFREVLERLDIEIFMVVVQSYADAHVVAYGGEVVVLLPDDLAHVSDTVIEFNL